MLYRSYKSFFRSRPRNDPQTYERDDQGGRKGDKQGEKLNGAKESFESGAVKLNVYH